ncbi:sugar phosphate permease [Actinocorallia herbida]|uniref:Sugar phosphate permease n=1 Tax=Actinocorallia herbida TaxID=58109 RepID=A0A3N1D7W4_9ACTN|nr:MFS transporter [Actinocorallia herbida]ROO89614.1 sugar phosphate permease [Actinocorallia herbida]
MPNVPVPVPSVESAAPPVRRLSRTVWVFASVAVLAYIAAVLHRTSFGVASLEASERFGISAGVLSSFTVLQVLVYASLQIPVGILLDRYGPRIMIAAGALLMAAGQVMLALAPNVATAVGARVLVGAGDAATFISVLGLVNGWFPPRHAPLATQLIATLGQIGQVLSAIPLVALLHGPGWQAAFGSVAAVGVLVGILALLVLRDPPHLTAARAPDAPSERLLASLAAAWRRPGTRLGVWTHFTTQVAGNAFVLMWGYPYLVTAQGLSPETAGALLTVFVIATMVAGPVLGRVLGPRPHLRTRTAVGIVLVLAACWTAVLLWPGHAPFWLLVLLIVTTSVGGPASMIGMDHARDHNPPASHGVAAGIVNGGGFFAAMLAILAMGLILDFASPSGAFTPESFRLAWLALYPLWLIGLLQITRTSRFAQLPPPR